MTSLIDFELTWTDGSEPRADADWIPAVVPGGVHESLLAAGRIEHPYSGHHEHELGWVHDATWWYRTTFPHPGDETVTHLDFAGLDTVAEVRLNGSVVGAARNQHRAHRFEVSGLLEDTNELLVRFPPPFEGLLSDDEVAAAIDDMRSRQSSALREVTDDELRVRILRARLRKATFSWGWDFAPVVTSRGISGPVSLTTSRPALRDVRVRSVDLDIESRKATLVVTGSADGPVTVSVTSPSDETVTAAAEGDFAVRFPLRDVALWWPHDLGESALYDVVVVSGGARTAVRHGVRTIEIDRSPDPGENAELFRFLVNGVPTFARGANVVPATMLVGSWPDENARALVEQARDGGMNMLRVWGGGVIAPEAFYDACDELGVLVWQDFLFACFDYPDPRGELAAEVTLEAADQVRRLRHHASLALWCGENEIQAIRELTTGNADPAGDWGWAFFNEVLPAAVADHDPDTAYWPGSPWGSLDGSLLNGTAAGDRHAWEVWHGAAVDIGAGAPPESATRGELVHFNRYENDRGRFISEFGIHASPELGTLERWTPPGTLAPGSDELHQRNKDNPKDKGYTLMAYETGEPTTIEEYVDFTMACQAEGLKGGVEHYRRRQPHCGGTLVWQLNDCWPGLSWSVIDYDLVPKASYYFLQRAYQPLLASFRVDDRRLELWVTNSGAVDARLDLTIETGATQGGAVRHASLPVVAPAYSSALAWTGEAPEGHNYAWVSDATGTLPANRRLLGRVKDVLGDVTSKLVARVLASEPGHSTVELRAQGYCYLARVMSDQPGARFSTNYLDLRDGDTAVIHVTGLRPGAGLSAANYGGPTVDLGTSSR